MKVNERKSVQLPLISNNSHKFNIKLLNKIESRNDQTTKQDSISTHHINCNLSQETSFINKETPRFEKFYKKESKDLKSNISLLKRGSTSFRRNSQFITFLANKNKAKNSTKPKNKTVNSFLSNTLSQNDLSQLELINQSVQASFSHLITDVNQGYQTSQMLNTRYKAFLLNEENRRNEQLDLKPDVNQPLFIIGENNRKNNFAHVIEQLLTLKTKITPKLIKEIARNNLNTKEADKRRKGMIIQRNGKETIMKLLQYREKVSQLLEVKEKKEANIN